MIQKKDIEELAEWLRKHSTKKQWKDGIQAWAFKNGLTIKEALKVVKENMDYIKGGNRKHSSFIGSSVLHGKEFDIMMTVIYVILGLIGLALISVVFMLVFGCLASLIESKFKVDPRLPTYIVAIFMYAILICILRRFGW